ncbi:unnamed protein product, partial [Pleuronectes platessa]
DRVPLLQAIEEACGDLDGVIKKYFGLHIQHLGRAHQGPLDITSGSSVFSSSHHPQQCLLPIKYYGSTMGTTDCGLSHDSERRVFHRPTLGAVRGAEARCCCPEEEALIAAAAAPLSPASSQSAESVVGKESVDPRTFTLDRELQTRVAEGTVMKALRDYSPLLLLVVAVVTETGAKDMKAHSMVTVTEAITADNDAHLFKNANLCIIQTLCRPKCVPSESRNGASYAGPEIAAVLMMSLSFSLQITAQINTLALTDPQQAMPLESQPQGLLA